MIVVIDCNIWISLVLTHQIDFIADLSDNGVAIASCDFLLEEISSVLKRPKFTKIVSPVAISEVVELHNYVTTNFKLNNIPKVVSDPKDNYLFALAQKAGADYMVTGDKLVLQEVIYGVTKIISLSDFKRIYSRSERL